jgi:hypothetical protein
LAVRPWKEALGTVHVLPSGCGAPGTPWHRVLLKHPGGVPAGAGGEGGAIGEFAPPVWQKAHTEAFPGSVVLWFLALVGSHWDGWGESTPAPWQALLLRQETFTTPPSKFVPELWHVWQKANPFEPEGAPFAAVPWESGFDHPAGCPEIAPWHRVLLKHPGCAPGSGAGGGGSGEFAPPAWQVKHTGALPWSVLICTNVSPGSQLAGWGDAPPPPWQAALRHATCAPPPEKSSAWQIWQETKPEEPGAFFASAPWTAGETQAATVPWWQLAAFWKQETLAIPPVRSSPWHVVHSLTSETANPGWVESQSAGWVPPPGPGLKLEVVSLLLEQPARNTSARIPQRIVCQGRNLFPAPI